MYCSHLQQLFRIVLDRQDRQAVEDLRKGAFHDFTVFQHIGNAGRATEIVFQHVHLAVAVAHQVGAGDVAPDAARRLQPAAFFQQALARGNQPLGHDMIADDLALVVDVVDEQIQRVDSLFQSTFDAVPLGRIENARHDVERPDLFGAGFVAVHVEGDAHVQQRQIGGFLATLQFAVGEQRQAARQQLGARPGTPLGVEHLVVKSSHLIGVEFHGADPKQWMGRGKSLPRRRAQQRGTGRRTFRHFDDLMAGFGMV